jgi:hypothetical protein
VGEVGRVAGARVARARPAGRRRVHQHPRPGERVERGGERRGGEVCAGRELRVLHAPAEHGGQVEHGPGVGREAADPLQHGVADGARQGGRVGVPPVPPPVALGQLPRGHEPLERLLDEERVAAGARVQQLRERAHGGRVGTEGALHQLGRLRGGERSHGGHARGAERGERLLGGAEQRVLVALGFVVRPHHQEARRARVGLAGDEVEQLGGRRVGPLQVLEHEEQRAPRGEPGQQLRHAPEEPRLGLGGRGPRGGDGGRRRVGPQGGEEARELAGRAAGRERERGRVEAPERGEECVGEDRVRHPGLDGVRAPLGEAPAAARGLRRDRLDEAGLAHPALTRQQEQGGPRGGAGRGAAPRSRAAVSQASSAARPTSGSGGRAGGGGMAEA